LSGKLEPTSGGAEFLSKRHGPVDIFQLGEQDRRRLQREEWGFVHQNPRDGLRMRVSGGANVAEPLMNLGGRHSGQMRRATTDWLERVELDISRVDHKPRNFSGGMQQRIQIARNLIHQPRLVFMDEPTGGLDVSVQARLLDLLRELVRDLQLSAIIVTHDMGVARLMADRLLVMKNGDVVETGLTDQVLDDAQHPYTQLLVSSVLQL
jgi:putative phosphonate transport system ATP-binding protein